MHLHAAVKKYQEAAAKLLSVSLTALGVRPVLFLDSYLRQIKWLGLSVPQLRLWALKSGMVVMHHRVQKTPQYVAEPDNSKVRCGVYRGVHIFPTIEYSLYVSLDLAPHEFSIENPLHRHELAIWDNYARSVIDELYVQIDKYKPKAVVVPQGYFVEGAVARQLAGHFAYQIFSLENTLHSGALICEPISGISVNKNSAMLYYYRLKDCIDNGAAEVWMDNTLDKIEASKQKQHASPITPYQWPEGLRRILFLGQCFTDSSVLFGVNGDLSIVEIAHALKRYATESRAHVFFKLHPKESGGLNPLQAPYDQLSLRKLRQANLEPGAANACPDVNWAVVDGTNAFSTRELIKSAEVVVTINSQAGLEALALGKEVILLGEAFYDRLGVTWNVSSEDMLPSALEQVLNGGARLMNRSTVAGFLQVYLESYCVKKDDRSVIRAIKDRCYRDNVSWGHSK